MGPPNSKPMEGDKPMDGGGGGGTQYCILSKAYHSDSGCTSAVSYTEKVAMFYNDCISDGASTSYKITACTSTGWTRTGYSVASCASGDSAVSYTSSQCIQVGSTSVYYKATITAPKIVTEKVKGANMLASCGALAVGVLTISLY